MVAYFWTTVPLVYGETVLTLIRAAGLLPAAVSDLLAVAFLMLVLWARWFVARTCLAGKVGEAAAVVAGTLAFDIIVGKMLSPLLQREGPDERDGSAAPPPPRSEERRGRTRWCRSRWTRWV